MQTSKQIYAAMVAKAQFFTVPELKKQITKLNDVDSDEAGTLMAVFLDVLQTRVKSAEFIEFCDSH